MQVKSASRRAFVLSELLVALTLLGIVAGAITLTMWRHSRGAQAAIELSELRDQLSEGAAVLSASLRGISPPGGDIYPGTMGPSSVEVRAPFANSIICGTAPNTILLPPNSILASGTRLTFFYRRVDPGHGALILDEGSTPSPADDTWVLRNVTAVATLANACGGAPFTSAADAALSGYRITLDAALPAGAGAGSPVIFVERMRFALYRAGDNRWYLGSCSSNSMSSSCSTLQPLAGPFLSANADQTSGLSGLDLYYFDANALPTTNPLNVARIDIALRGSTVAARPLSGSMSAQASGQPTRDTVRLVVELRNR